MRVGGGWPLGRSARARGRVNLAIRGTDGGFDGISGDRRHARYRAARPSSGIDFVSLTKVCMGAHGVGPKWLLKRGRKD
jgi:hypothetical protein